MADSKLHRLWTKARQGVILEPTRRSGVAVMTCAIRLVAGGRQNVVPRATQVNPRCLERERSLDPVPRGGQFQPASLFLPRDSPRSGLSR